MSDFIQKCLRRFLGLPPETARQNYVRCISPAGLHRMRYLEWGEADNPRVLVCVHGLTRNAHDFDFLARALAKDYRVICPDVVGRGGSDWLRDPSLYAIPQYVADMVTLLARLDVESIDWLGTSMGGLIGMALAAQVDTPIKRLILNDVGPVVSSTSLQRIGEYVGAAPDFPNFDAALAYIKKVSAPFGPLSEVQWKHLTEYSVHPIEKGLRMNYDPAIAKNLHAMKQTEDVSAWPIYNAIPCPTLIIRGAQSDLLSAEVAHQMQHSGPHAKLVELEGIGHAPALMSDEQIQIVADFLAA